MEQKKQEKQPKEVQLELFSDLAMLSRGFPMGNDYWGYKDEKRKRVQDCVQKIR